MAMTSHVVYLKKYINPCLSLVGLLLIYLMVSKMYSDHFKGPMMTRYLPHSSNEVIFGRDQDDKMLINHIKKYEILPPSKLPYNLKEPKRRDYSQYGQSEYAHKYFLKNLKGGFFLEAGALDGEDKSNSLFFEKYEGWVGLLVEPDPVLFNHLMGLNRKAFAINAGFSLGNTSATANFVPNRGLGRIKPNAETGVEIKTFPLYSMLRALGVDTVDFFSLDIEGVELPVLNTIPWDKIKFRLICIEINKYRGGVAAAVKYFEHRGYVYLGVKDIDAWFGWKDLLKQTMDVDEWVKVHAHV